MISSRWLLGIAICSLSMLAAASQTFNLGTVQADGAVGVAANSDGTIVVTETGGIAGFRTSGTLTFTAGNQSSETRLRLVEPDSTVWTIQLAPSGLTSGTFIASAPGRYPNTSAPGTWTWEIFTATATSGIDYTITDFNLEIVSAIPTGTDDPFTTFNNSLNAGLAGLLGTGLAGEPSWWMEARTNSVSAPVTFTNAPGNRQSLSLWGPTTNFANVPGDAAVKVLFDGATAMSEWLISPLYDFGPTPGAHQIQFDIALTELAGTAASAFTGTQRMSVFLSDAGGSAWADQAAGGANEIRRFDSATPVSNTGQTISQSFQTFGERRIAFGMYKPAAPGDIEVFLDDVRVLTLVQLDVEKTGPDTTFQRGFSQLHPLTVENRGIFADVYTPGFVGNAWTCSLVDSDGITPLASVNVAAESTANIFLKVDVPAAATPASTDTVTLTLTGTSPATDNISYTTTAGEYSYGGNATDYFFANSSSHAQAFAPSAPDQSFEDITAIGTPLVGLTDDGAVGPITLPFFFAYFGVALPQMWVHGNGFVSFTDPDIATHTTNIAMPNAAAPLNAIAWWWDDLDFTNANVTGQQVLTHGDASRYIIQFNKMPLKGAVSPDAWVTAQIVLFPGGNFRLNYLNRGSAMPTLGQTVGLNDIAGVAGMTYRHNTNTTGLLHFPMTLEFGQTAAGLPVALSGMRTE